MRLELRGRHLAVSSSLRQQAERRLGFALGRFGGLVERVALRVEDVNGPRGGIDKQCRVVVGLRRAGEVVVEAADGDVYVLIDRAAQRAGRAVRRRVERLRERVAPVERGAWRGA